MFSGTVRYNLDHFGQYSDGPEESIRAGLYALHMFVMINN